MRALILAATLAVASLAGCAGLDDHQQRVGSGALIGAGAGALIGGNATGAIIGGVAGGLIGNEVDHNAKRDQENRRYNECRRYHDDRYCAGR